MAVRSSLNCLALAAADALSPVGKTWSADVASKGGPGPEVLKGYMDALKRSGAALPRDWSAN